MTLFESRTRTALLVLIVSCSHAACLGGDGGGGGGDSGGTPGGSIEGVNVSEARIESIVNALCRRDARCEPDDFEARYDGVADCSSEMFDDFDRPQTAFEDRCADSALDAASCIAQMPCDADSELECGDLLDARWTACSPN